MMLMNSTQTRTLVVNPAFLQEIKDSNTDLWHSFHELRQTCQRAAGPVGQANSAQTAKRLVRLLDDLRDLLGLQFALEESYGFVSLPGPSNGSRTGELSELMQVQHCSLFLRLSDLAERAEELQYRGMAEYELDKLISEATMFDAALREHERLEAELIERAFDGH